MEYKDIIVAAGLKMLHSGLTIETWGNISIRAPDTGLVYLTPSAMPYDTIKPEDVVVCDITGQIIEGHRKPTIEKELHLAVYRARQEVNAIIHTHPLYSMIYACQGKTIPLFTDEAAQSLGDECTCATYELPGTDALAQACAKALGEKANSCLLHSHGAVCVGETLDAAFRVCTVLEVTANIYYMIEATGGKPKLISREKILAMQDFVKNHYGQNK
ncbi:class II aldolase/adducin family protein [Treponema parvum]|uniref:Class II aldolase/adducin family protein n=1 Tax=Treponema parvum TaxID=138851 RepID=A0A975F436_9SPIR|nr:class II aldolase/adducin family protein [Treponema parvum]QTQ13988.1 class II aldolase/adducin family protein [Treponema parvum]